MIRVALGIILTVLAIVFYFVFSSPINLILLIILLIVGLISLITAITGFWGLYAVFKISTVK
ncbi:MAG: YgaP-like transmembrane domain [Candidatus Heimdallarchaeaceae archaeon]